MRKQYPENIPELIEKFDQLLRQADAQILHQTQALEKEKQEYEARWEKENAEQQGRTENIRANLHSRLDSIQKEACLVRDQMYAANGSRSISGAIAALARSKGIVEPVQYYPQRFNLKSVDDCANALDKIKSDFNYIRFGRNNSSLGKSLSNLFASSKNDDTARLTALIKTMQMFLGDLEQQKEEILAASEFQYKQMLTFQAQALQREQSQKQENFEKKQQEQKEALRNKVRQALNGILSEENTERLATQLMRFREQRYTIRLSGQTDDPFLTRIQLVYIPDQIKSEVLKSALKKYASICSKDGIFYFPYGMSVSGGRPWFVVVPGDNPELGCNFVNTMMFDMLSTTLPEKLTYTVVDPLKGGSSLSLLHDLYRLLPEMFGKKIYTGRDEIADRIRKISAYVTRTLQDKLGGTYHTVYDYAGEHAEYEVQTEFLVLFDFPAGMDEYVLQDLLNIVSNGSKCAIFTCICAPNRDGEYSEVMNARIKEVSQQSEVFVQPDAQHLLLNGNLVRMYSNIASEEAKQLLGRYILFYEDKKNQGTVLSQPQRTLIFTRDSEQADAAIAQLYQTNQMYRTAYGTIRRDNRGFPEAIPLGIISFPSALFEKSPAYHQMQELFGTEDPKHQGGWRMELPMVVELNRGMHFYLKHRENTRKVLTFSHHVIWSLLSFLPVGKVNVCVFDGKQRGNSMIPFLDFRKRCPDVFDEKIYTSQEDMYERLRRLNGQIDEFIQDKLGNRYQDFLEYNRNTPSRQEPATLLVLYDFPTGMDKRNMELLLNVLQNGKRCGVYVMICHNQDIAFSSYENLEGYVEEMEKSCQTVTYSDGNLMLTPYDFPLHVPRFPETAEIDAFAEEYGKRITKTKNQGISFDDILPVELFAAESSENLSIPAGIGDRSAVVNLVMGQGSSHHGLIAGATGSGKSTLLHTIIMSSMLKYDPDQLQLYLMDFKSGTEFKIYESVKLPHIRLLALDAMQEFGESILENLVQEMEQRAERFKEEAGGVTAIRDYVRVTGKTMPRILVIIDEFQILFNDAANRKVAEHCAELAKRIVTEGRAFGIHLLMATQSMRGISNMALISGIVEQMLIRVGLKCGESDIRYLFPNADCGKVQTMMKGPVGTAVMNLDYTEKPEAGFRVAYFDDDAQRRYLEKISEKYADYPARLQVFEGKRTEKLLDYFRREGLGKTEELPVRIHMGMPVKVAPPYTITIDKKRKHNLLICGSDIHIAARVADNYMISALMNQNATVYCADGDLLVDDDSAKPFYDLLAGWSGRFTLAQDRGDIIRMIGDVYSQYQERKKKNKKDAIFVVFKNLQFLDIVGMMLRGETIEEGDYLEEEPEGGQPEISDPIATFDFDSILTQPRNEDSMSAGEKLIRLIESGSMYGISFVISSLEYQTVKDTMGSYGENTLKHFPERVVFSLSQGDAEFLLDDISISGLQNQTVYFTDGIREKLTIKPYITPEVYELKEYLEKI